MGLTEKLQARKRRWEGTPPECFNPYKDYRKDLFGQNCLELAIISNNTKVIDVVIFNKRSKVSRKGYTDN